MGSFPHDPDHPGTLQRVEMAECVVSLALPPSLPPSLTLYIGLWSRHGTPDIRVRVDTIKVFTKNGDNAVSASGASESDVCESAGDDAGSKSGVSEHDVCEGAGDAAVSEADSEVSNAMSMVIEGTIHFNSLRAVGLYIGHMNN